MSEEAAPTEATPVYKHSLSGHAVRGDGTFEEAAASTATDDYRQQKLPEFDSFAKALTGEEEKEDKPMEPLPELPAMPMSVDDAYKFLGVADKDRGSLEKVKMRFRKLSLKWHPDKNMKREKEAAEVFRAVHAAYHFLTTNNFDYKRWAESFVIPPMQTLEDVLLMALKGADPYQLELLLRKRGDYRPHAEFGINLSIPWSAGTKEAPSYDVSSGSVYTTTQGIEEKRRAELGYSGGGGSVNEGAIVTTTAGMDTDTLLQKFGKNAMVGQAEARPWETVGGVGFETAKKEKAPLYIPPKTRPDLTPSSAEAKIVAEEFNDQAVKAFKDKKWQLTYDFASEAIRLNPRKTAYLGNRAAAALKMGGAGMGKRYYRTAAEDSVLAYELDPKYSKAYVRAADAHLALNERATVKLAIQEYKTALEMDPDSKKLKDALKDAQLTWEADFE
uniref:J domain-containing protein n=1 Tax=Haptolina ericina TaxID=156174 RepID=A0A7S3AQP2_9EUKA